MIKITGALNVPSIEIPIKRHTRIEKVTDQYEKSGIYVIQFECGGIKIGRATNIKYRLGSYKSPWCKKITKIICYRTKNSISIERRIINTFSRYAKENSREFFRCSLSLIIQYIESPNSFYLPPVKEKEVKTYLYKDAVIHTVIKSRG